VIGVRRRQLSSAAGFPENISAMLLDGAGTGSTMPDDQQNLTPDDDRLKGWKEIAQCLHSSERTVQRWEHVLHLPVHRIGMAGNAIVLASRRELEDWLESIEGRTALSEQDDADSALELPAGSGVANAETSAGETLTPGALDDTPEARAALANRAEQGRSYWRRFGWVLLALGVVALVIGFVPLAKSKGRNLLAPEKAAAPSATTPANGRATGPSASLIASTVAVRFTLDDSTSSIVGIQVGGTSTITVGSHTTYVFSAELLGDVARVHVSRLDGGTAQNAPRLNELAVVTLHLGARVPVEQVPGITAMEWLEPAAWAKGWRKKPG